MDEEKEMLEMLELNELDLKYEVGIEGFDGECFMYSVYFEDKVSEENYASVEKVIEEYINQNEEDDEYPGYISVTNEENKVSIYHDLGNTDGTNRHIHGVLNAINSVPGVKKVIINEGSMDIPDISLLDIMKMLQQP